MRNTSTTYKRNRDNPYNTASPLYKSLTRLLSGPITNYKQENARIGRKKDLDKYKFTSASGKAFKKSSAYNPFKEIQTGVMANASRAERYMDFEMMELTPEIASALDIYADEITTYTQFSPLLKIVSPNQEIAEILDFLFYDVLNIELNAHIWTRTACKYGDLFLYLDIDDEKGITNAIALPAFEIERLEGEDPTNPNYVQFQWNAGGLTFENWQVAHVRILGNDKFIPYGSCLKGDTRIDTVDGPVLIENIKKGDIVYSLDLKTHEKLPSVVLDTVCSGEKDCIEIRTRHQFIESSKEHRFLILNKKTQEFEYKFVKDLNLGDLLVTDSSISSGKEIKINKSKPNENKNGWWNNFDCVPDFVDEDFARFFGFMIGDGWIPKHNNKVCFARGEYEELNERYLTLLEKYSGSVGKSVFRNDEHDKINSYEVNSKMFKTILKRMGFFGKANTKRIPEWVFNSSLNIRKAFINGLYDADGCSFVDKWNCTRYQIELSNEQLIKDFKYLINSVGYKSGKITSRKRHSNAYIKGRKINSNTSWYFYWFETNRTQAKKHNLIEKKIDNFIISPIISMEKTGKAKVYDIFVENDNHNFYANGVVVHNSVLEGARRIWRQLTLIEDAVMAYRIVRSPERRVFKIDVGGIDPKDVPSYMEQIRTELKRNQVVDPSTGRVDLRYSPLSIEEDYFIPVRKGDSSNIETLAGGSYTGDIDDVKYLRDKLFTALKIPASYLSQGEGMEEKSSLAQKDIMFARTIIRIQNTIASEFRKIAIIHLATLGYKGNDLINFDLSFHNPSRISELQELEYMRTKFAVAVEAKDLYSQTWIDKNILSMSDEEIIRNRMEKFTDVKFEISLEAFLEQSDGMDMDGGPGIASGGASEGLGGLPNMDKVDNSAAPGANGGGEENLLAVSPTEDDVAELNGQPRKRDLSKVQKDARRNASPTEKSLEPQAKGSAHHAVKKNHDQRLTSGPRKRSRRNASGGFVGSPSMEELFGGLNMGLANLTKGVFESESIDEDEELLTEISHKIKTTLINKRDLINKSISNMNKLNRQKIDMELEEEDDA